VVEKKERKWLTLTGSNMQKVMALRMSTATLTAVALAVVAWTLNEKSR
jgi:hypothetical protein